MGARARAVYRAARNHFTPAFPLAVPGRTLGNPVAVNGGGVTVNRRWWTVDAEIAGVVVAVPTGFVAAAD